MSILHHAPTFTREEALQIALDRYHLVGSVTELPSERDQNFLLTTHAGEKFILKISNAAELSSLLEAQNDAMAHLASRLSFCPRVIFSESGEALAQVETATSRHLVRLVTFLPGEPLAEVEQSPRVLLNFGKRLGEFSRAISDFDHPAFHRDFHWDLANGQKLIEEYSPLVADEELQRQVEKYCTVFDTVPNLPFALIHGDANDYNVLVEAQDVVGLIDFGDMIYSYRAGELAIALAYVVLNKADPIMSAKAVVAGYRAEFELNENEIVSLWPLMLLRLCMSICVAAHQCQQKPDNKYLDVSQRAIRTSLPRLLASESSFAATTFLSADYTEYTDVVGRKRRSHDPFKKSV